KDHGAIRSPDLAQIVRRWLVSRLGKAGLHALERRGVDLGADAEKLGDDIDGEIILGRTEAARAEHQLGAPDRVSKGAAHVVPVVAAAGHPGHRHAELPKPRRHPRRIGIDDLTATKLVANRENFGAHGASIPRLTWVDRLVSSITPTEPPRMKIRYAAKT